MTREHQPDAVAEDVWVALQAVSRATQVLTAVAVLPRRVGDRIRWTPNGLIWERIGGDEWQPNEPPLEAHLARLEGWTAPSAHVASGAFEILEPDA